MDDIVENVLVQQIDDTTLVILHNWWKKTALKISFNSAGRVRRANLVAQVNLPWSFCFCTETSFHGPLLWPSPVLLYLSFDMPAGGLSTPDDHFEVSALLKPCTSHSLYSQHVPLSSSYFVEKIDASEGLEPPSPAPQTPVLQGLPPSVWLRAYEEEGPSGRGVPLPFPRPQDTVLGIVLSFFNLYLSAAI